MIVIALLVGVAGGLVLAGIYRHGAKHPAPPAEPPRSHGHHGARAARLYYDARAVQGGYVPEHLARRAAWRVLRRW